MRGLMQSEQPVDENAAPVSEAAPMPEAPQEAEASEAGAEMEGMENASPEEQALYDELIANSYNLIYDKKALPGVLKSLQGDVPGEALALTAATIVKELTDSARKNGKEFPGDVLLNAGQEIVEELADLQMEAGIADLSQEDLEGAFYKALDLYREMAQADGTLDVAALEQDFKAMVEADANGNLEKVVPGADDAAGRFKSGMEAAAKMEAG